MSSEKNTVDANNMRISEKVLKRLFMDNEKRIQERITRVLKEKEPDRNVLLVMDFDECAVNEHLSRLVTESYEHRAQIVEEDKYDTGIASIANLFHCYVELTEEEFAHRLKQLAETVTWRNGFLPFMKAVQKREDVLPVFVSSGLTDSAKVALGREGLDSVAIIGDELDVGSDGKIRGPYTVIGTEEKGDIVAGLISNGGFRKCVTVGHSGGDVDLIKQGTKGYRHSFRDSESAMSVADNLIETWTEIKLD